MVSWCFKKQTVVSRSSTESEYRTLATAAFKVIWIKSLLIKLGISLNYNPYYLVWQSDNHNADVLSSNPKFHSCTKHIALDVHFLREKITNQSLQVCYVPSSDNTADILTFWACEEMLGCYDKLVVPAKLVLQAWSSSWLYWSMLTKWWWFVCLRVVRIIVTSL